MYCTKKGDRASKGQLEGQLGRSQRVSRIAETEGIERVERGSEAVEGRKELRGSRRQRGGREGVQRQLGCPLGDEEKKRNNRVYSCVCDGSIGRGLLD